MNKVETVASPKVLVIDVGGTNIKLLATGQKDSRKIASGPSMTPSKMVREVKNCVKDWNIDDEPASALATHRSIWKSARWDSKRVSLP